MLDHVSAVDRWELRWGESSRVESSRVESNRVEPSRAEPSRAEPSRVKLSPVQSSRAEPSRVGWSLAVLSRSWVEPSWVEPVVAWQHLATLLIMQQVIDQLVESVLPYLVYKRRKLAICRGNKQPDDCRPLVATGDNLRTSIEASKDAYEVRRTADDLNVWLLVWEGWK